MTTQEQQQPQRNIALEAAIQEYKDQLAIATDRSAQWRMQAVTSAVQIEQLTAQLKKLTAEKTELQKRLDESQKPEMSKTVVNK